ncbi:hypothetical protein SSS_07636 [Sarcoptes scabiei]|uniref:Uncharacterized protein n=1 Tax=Sarcoptes scabiei TaxID=52283 RepID=A0A834RDQ8_SARSC|nr:hypothetical protein SSS_07636 [Sarcoptes scabiei]
MSYHFCLVNLLLLLIYSPYRSISIELSHWRNGNDSSNRTSPIQYQVIGVEQSRSIAKKISPSNNFVPSVQRNRIKKEEIRSENESKSINDSKKLLHNDQIVNDGDFCSASFVDSAYFNGYDIILTRNNFLWYYYKDRHRTSRAFDQRKFTQGDLIQGAFNVSRTPMTCLKRSNQQVAEHKEKNAHRQTNTSLINDKFVDACNELQKLRSMAVYFLHNISTTRSYYNMDVRYPNGTQRRVRSKDLPWNMKQVDILNNGILWPREWNRYQRFRPAAFFPSRLEIIFIINQINETAMNTSKASILVWNDLDSPNWNSSWRSQALVFDPPVFFTGMFEMDGVVYAIGEKINSANLRTASMFQYHIIDDDRRDLKLLNQTLQQFFGCPNDNIVDLNSKESEESKNQIDSNSLSARESLESESQSNGENKSNEKIDFDDGKKIFEDSKTEWINKKTFTNELLANQNDLKVFQNSNQIDQTILNIDERKSVFLDNSKAKIQSVTDENKSQPFAVDRHQYDFIQPKLASSLPKMTIRESDSIMLMILIAIVIGASVLCIVLACLVMNETSRTASFERAYRIDKKLPRSNIIGIDYQPRKNSTSSSLMPFNFLTRYDSINSLTAIYSQIQPNTRFLTNHSNHYKSVDSNLIPVSNTPVQTLFIDSNDTSPISSDCPKISSSNEMNEVSGCMFIDRKHSDSDAKMLTNIMATAKTSTSSNGSNVWVHHYCHSSRQKRSRNAQRQSQRFENLI